MKEILWLSRHRYLPSQVAELNRIFGGVYLFQDPNPFSSAEDIKRRVVQGGYDEIVVVAPLSVIAKLTELGIKPLWAEMETVKPEEAEVEVGGRYLRFTGFKRIEGIEIKFTGV